MFHHFLFDGVKINVLMLSRRVFMWHGRDVYETVFIINLFDKIFSDFLCVGH